MFGLTRTVTLYAIDGSTIDTWTGNFKVQYDSGFAQFMDNGKAVTISGTIRIVEH